MRAMRAPLTWTFLVVSSLAACSGTGDARGGPNDDRGDGGGTSSGSTDPGGDGGERDPYDPGCDPIKEGPRSGTVATSTPRDGEPGAAWTTPENALTPEDDAFAQAVLDGHAETDVLLVKGFGFQLPPGARVTGVEVQLRRRAPEGGVVDAALALSSRDRVGRYKYISSEWPKSIVGTHHYGQAVDPWGIPLTREDVADPEFGVTLRAKRAEGATGAPVANVDSLRMSVFYCVD